MEPLGVMAHGAPCSCVLSSSPSPPSPLDSDCFWIVGLTSDWQNDWGLSTQGYSMCLRPLYPYLPMTNFEAKMYLAKC